MKAALRGLLKVEQVAEATGWSEATVRKMVLRRQIPYVKLGKSIRFKPEVVEKLIEENIVPALAR